MINKLNSYHKKLAAHKEMDSQIKGKSTEKQEGNQKFLSIKYMMVLTVIAIFIKEITTSTVLGFAIAIIITPIVYHVIPAEDNKLKMKAEQYLKKRYKIPMKVKVVEECGNSEEDSNLLTKGKDPTGINFYIFTENNPITDAYFTSYWEKKIQEELIKYLEEKELIKKSKENQAKVFLYAETTIDLYEDYETPPPYEVLSQRVMQQEEGAYPMGITYNAIEMSKEEQTQITYHILKFIHDNKYIPTSLSLCIQNTFIKNLQPSDIEDIVKKEAINSVEEKLKKEGTTVKPKMQFDIVTMIILLFTVIVLSVGVFGLSLFIF
ncbi:hypothetical protein SAMN05446037_100523 [Anaerovirgula multivorans]|uniref:Uncharacterized protein n=1 Tax=Anaerovirgula multivorans TaxID=312168 RepID=A0A239C773_9FIRM|nr:hypothetical protein [Anaerovirgula multivorans]SNS15518.1 hypothetical protein SAMN05446037_100523 [Anaerovirgula multivorans]